MCTIKRADIFLRAVAAILGGILLAAALPPVHAAGGDGWYCAHVKDHAQPRLDAQFNYVEGVGGYYIDHRHYDPAAEDKVVYLTFDAGYENGNISRVLDALQEEGVSGAFFILGHLTADHPELVRRMAEEGHLVCNHTFTHKNLVGAGREALAEELGRLESACRENCGVEVAKYYRPPEGRFDRAMLEAAQDMGYKTIFWSFAYADWDNQKQPSPAAAKQKILENVHNGAVLLLHPTSGTNAAILADVIRTLKGEGYRFGTLDELTATEVPTSALWPEGEDIIYHGRPDGPKSVALSFDDGPHPYYTPLILEILAEYDIRATFFMVGENITYYTAAAEAVLEAGHEIGNHTYSHKRFNRMSEHEMESEIAACEDAISSISEYRPRFVRPPEGQMNEAMRRVIGHLGYRIVLWDVDTRDWAHTPPAAICEHILATVKPGDIILMHDFIGHDSPTPEALRLIIPALLSEGYRFVTVGELVDGN